MPDQRSHRNWSEIYSSVDDHPWSGTDLVEAFAERLDTIDPEPKTVLDIGCGEGDKSRWFAEKGYEVQGIDFSPEAIETARQQSAGQPIEYYELDIVDLATLGISEDSIGLVFDSGSSQFLPTERQAAYFKTIDTYLSEKGALLYLALAASGPNAPAWLHNIGITQKRFRSLTNDTFQTVSEIDRSSRNLKDVTVFGGLFVRKEVTD